MADPADWCGSALNEGGACTLPNDRHSFNAHVTQQDLIETFIPPFEQAVKAQVSNRHVIRIILIILA